MQGQCAETQQSGLSGVFDGLVQSNLEACAMWLQAQYSNDCTGQQSLVELQRKYFTAPALLEMLPTAMYRLTLSLTRHCSDPPSLEDQLAAFSGGFVNDLREGVSVPALASHAPIQLSCWSTVLRLLQLTELAQRASELEQYLNACCNALSTCSEWDSATVCHVLASAIASVAFSSLEAVEVLGAAAEHGVETSEQHVDEAIKRIEEAGSPWDSVRCTVVRLQGLGDAQNASEWGEIYVFDGAFSRDLARAQYDEAAKASYRRIEFSTDRSFRHSVCDHELAQFALSPIGHVMMEAAKVCFHTNDLIPYRAYTNAMLSSDVSLVHADVPRNSDGVNVTVLAYPMDIATQWDPSWGGETVFFDDNFEIVFSVLPKIGRLVVFDSRIRHCGRVPNSLFRDYRFSLALKLSDVDENPHIKL